MNAVVTAGGTLDGEYAALAGTRVKALAAIRGKSMLDRAIEAAYDAGAARVAVVGGQEVAAACGSRVDAVIDASPDGSQNVRRALNAWPQDDALLYLTSDMPYVTGVALREFLTRVPAGALAVSLTSYIAFAARFPGAPPFGIALGGERVVNGGAFVLPPGSAQRVAGAAARFFEARKSRWAMVRWLGPVPIVRFAIGRLSIAALETYAGGIAGVPARAVRDCAPELAYDADLVAEYRYACERV